MSQITLLAANNATTTLAGSITNVATTANLAVGSGALFPTPAAGQFFVLTFVDAATGLLNEIVHVTNISGDTITMVRAQEGTSALAWSAGDLALSLVTAGSVELFTQPLQLQSQSGNSGTDTGTANALVLTLDPVPQTFADLLGTSLRIKKSAAANTGATTLNVNGFGVFNVLHADGSALGSGELPANGWFNVIVGAGSFTLSSVSAAPNNSVVSQNCWGGTSGGAANVQTLATTPTFASLVAGQMVTCVAGFANTGSATLNVNSTGPKTIGKRTGSGIAALNGGEIIVGNQYSFQYDGTNWQLLAPWVSTAATKSASDNTQTGVASVVGATTAGHIAEFNDTAGSVKDGGFGLAFSTSALNASWSAGAGFSVAHGLGAVPTMVWVKAKCTSAQGNYSVGQFINLIAEIDATGSVGTTYYRGVTVAWDGTNIIVNVASTGIFALDASSFNGFQLDNAHWSLQTTAMLVS